MQVPKDEIRSRILLSATEEFYLHGYKNASMRTIAENADITIGNIYSYFKGKEDLFSCTLEGVLSGLEVLISTIYKNEDYKSVSLSEAADLICSIFEENKKAFMIIISGSEGTAYHKVKGQIAEWVRIRLTADFLPYISEEGCSDELAKGLSAAVLEGIVSIMRSCFDDSKKMRADILRLLEIIVGSSLNKDVKRMHE